MPRIEEFEAKDVKLTPSDKGFSALETAARRIGPLYQQMAAGQRELGNLSKGADEAIGRTTEAFLRFQGLSGGGGGAGVKVGSGKGERTLLGTGAGGDTNWNARANASNDLTEKAAKGAAGTPGETAEQAAANQVGITLPLTAAQKKAAATAQKAVDTKQAAEDQQTFMDNNTAARLVEDKQRAATRAGEDNARKLWWDQNPINEITDPQAAKDMQVAKDTQEYELKRDRAQEDLNIQLHRDAIDAAIKEGRSAATLGAAQITLHDKQNINAGTKPLVDAARRTIEGLAPTATAQAVSEDAHTLHNSLVGERVPGHIPEVPDAGETPRSASDQTATYYDETSAAGMPTYLSDVPAVRGQPENNPPPTLGAEDIQQPEEGSPPQQQQAVQYPIDRPNVPGLYDDLTGGM